MLLSVNELFFVFLIISISQPSRSNFFDLLLVFEVKIMILFLELFLRILESKGIFKFKSIIITGKCLITLLFYDGGLTSHHT